MTPTNSPEPDGRKIGYARVSTLDQCEALQTDALNAAGCERIFVEAASAVGVNRPQFMAAMKHLWRGDTLVVWKLDRAFRSTLDAIETLNTLRQRGVGLLVTTLGFVSDTPEGRYFFRGLASAAEFERDMISVRTKEGLAAARRRGRCLGRPAALSDKQILDAHHDHLCLGTSIPDLAQRLNVSGVTLRRGFERLSL